MRFYEDLDYYYFSENPISDDEERSIIYEQCIGYLKEQMGRAFRPEASTGATVKKYFPIALFAIAVILLIFFSINKMVGALIFTFGGIFIAFGIMALLPGNKDQQVELPQQAKIPRGVGAAIAIMIGLAVIIPAIIAPKFGYTKSFLIAGGAWFTLAGLFFIVYTIIGMARFSRAQKNSVQGKCIGYIKMLEGSGTDTTYHQRRIVTGTPVFEYTIRGITYKAFQEDNMRTGRLTPNVGDTVDLGVLPEDSYAVFYHKNTSARVIAFVLSIMALAAGIFLFCMVPKFDDSKGFKVNTMGGDVNIAKVQFDDKDLESRLGTSDYNVSYVTVKSVYEEEGKWYVDLSDGSTKNIADDAKDSYYEGMEIYMIITNDVKDRKVVVYVADDYEYTGSHKVEGKTE